jgi:hypothetical protein
VLGARRAGRDAAQTAAHRGVLANLADYAEGREPTARRDFTTAVLRGEVLIDADRLAVYASLTEPEQFSRWSGAKLEAELHPGGR